MELIMRSAKYATDPKPNRIPIFKGSEGLKEREISQLTQVVSIIVSILLDESKLKVIKSCNYYARAADESETQCISFSYLSQDLTENA